MQGYNIIVVFCENTDKILMCNRKLMDLTYYFENYLLEVYVERLNKTVDVYGNE